MRGRLVALVAAVLVVLPLAPGASASPGGPRGVPSAPTEVGGWPADAVPGSVLVTTGRPADAERVLDRLSARGVPGVPAARGRRIAPRVVQVEVEPGREAMAARALSTRPGVRSVEPDLILQATVEPNDERYADQWAHVRTNAPAGWDVTTGNQDVRVAVLDTGIDGTHPELADNIREPQVRVVDGRVRESGTDVDNEPCRGEAGRPEEGHGTNVAGVIGAVGDNTVGIAGAAWRISIVDIALQDPRSNCSGYETSDVLAGMQYAVDQGVDVLNVSLGSPQDACPAAMQSIIDQAREADAVVVAASGNDGASTTFVPASCNGVISVGATDREDAITAYSTSNRYVDVTAPGGTEGEGPPTASTGILTTEHGGGLVAVQGTSFSTPYVAGLVGLLRASDPAATGTAVEAAVKDAAVDLGPAGRDASYGCGLIDVDRALRALAGSLSPSACAADPAFPVSESSTGDPTVRRVSSAAATTAPIPQAVAVSQEVFRDAGAVHALIARDDVFADALAGSALGYGHGPILFTGSAGSLAAPTRQELQRVLEPGATVYLLGGVEALPEGLEQEVRSLGFRPVRLAGSQREDTAAEIAREVERRGFRELDAVLLATRGNWPDAVTGGSLAAWFGTPIVLTTPDRLIDSTERILRELSPSELYVLGGTRVVEDRVAGLAAEAAGLDGYVRLAGGARDETGVEIAQQMEALLAQEYNALPGAVAAVNVDRQDGWAHVLSASAISGSAGAVFVPVRDPGTGPALTDPGRDYVTGFGIDGLAIGGTDLVPDAVEDELEQLLER